MSQRTVWDPTQYHRDGDLRLRPALERLLLTQLPADDAAHFSELCRRALREAYPPQSDGTTLFPFRRLFIVARR